MTQKFLQSTFLAAIAFSSTHALADQVLTPSIALFYFTESAKRNIDGPNGGDDVSQSTKTAYTFTTLGACYTLSSICLGLKYLQAEIETKTSSVFGTGETTAVFSGPGLTLGYSGSEGAVAHVSYLFGAKKTLTVTGDPVATYKASNALLLDLGYGFKVGSVRIGPLLTIMQFQYKELSQGGQTMTLRPKEGDDFTLPQVALWVDL